MSFNKIYRNKIFLKLLYYLGIFKFGFYFNAFIWHSKHRKTKKITTEKILKMFYHDFLKIAEEDCIIIEMNEKRLVTRCKNNCPILLLSLYIGIDTRKTCKQISEGPCKYFLKRINKNIVFERNYNHIRPYKSDCEETITIFDNS